MNPKVLFCTVVAFVLTSVFFKIQAQPYCSNLNQTLAFDGIDDYIVRNLNTTLVNGSGDFTVEAQFLSNPVSGYHLLFTLSDNASSSLLTAGLNVNGSLALFWLNNVGVGTSHPFLIPSIPANLTSTCHHLAITRQANTLKVYLDGQLASTLNSFNGTFQFSELRVGSATATLSSSRYWTGFIDEIRLWSIERTAAQIADADDCVLSSTVPGPINDLEVYWTLDPDPLGQNTVPGGNNAGALAIDESGHSNHGTLNNFSLSAGNFASNFICNTCPVEYGLDITDLPSHSISLLEICDGGAAHFCITQNGQALSSPPAGATVTWWYLDAGATVPQMITDPIFTKFCFGVPSGVIDISAACANSTTGYVDRTFWAVISKSLPGSNSLCSYTTVVKSLRIYCPVTNATLVLNPVIPTPPLLVLCEGTNYTTNVSISSTDAFVPGAVSPTGDLSIQWCINGQNIGSLADMGTIPYSGVANSPDLCFEAKLQNGVVCPLLTTQLCIPVDKDPVCGLIDVKPDLALMQDPNGGQYDYLICPGNDLELTMLNQLSFQDCDPVWQFMFPNTFPIWTDLNGASNVTQNTNTLPNYGPGTLPPHPIWPTGETAIRYRIECRPKSWPFSDCAPCHSNEVQITLKQAKPDPIITAAQNPICLGGNSVISVAPYDPNCSYDWYCNGLLVGSGPTLNATEPACYWVEVFDGCFIQTSQPIVLDVCEVVPIIDCPVDNPCACLGIPITLDGSNSYNTCGTTGPLPLQYSWSHNSTTPPLTGTSAQFVHTPDPSGTTYTLIVTDPNIPGGCWAATQLDIKPCQ